MSWQSIRRVVAVAAVTSAACLVFLGTRAERPAQAQAEPAQPKLQNLERRLEAVEKKLDDLLAERRSSPDSSFWDQEARTKAAIWARLVQDGFVGRFDNEEIAPDKLLTSLYRRYMKRRPTEQEMKDFLETYGPGAERAVLAPEIHIRRMLAAPSSPKTPLEEAIVHARN